MNKLLALLATLILVVACTDPNQGASSAKALTSFGLTSPKVAGSVDETSHHVAVSVPYATSVSSLVAVFTTTGARVVVAGVDQVSGTTAHDFSSPVTYTVVADDGSTQDYVVAVTPASAPPPSSALGTVSLTLHLGKPTGDVGRYGVFLWVEDSNGNFVRTLSHYIDWGSTSTDGSNGTHTPPHHWFVVGHPATTGSGDLHLLQSASWRQSSGVTTNPGTVDATTSATLGPNTNATAVLQFGGASPTSANALALGADEYFAASYSSLGSLQGWDGKDASGTPVNAGTYRLRLTLSRKTNTNAVSPYFTEYAAPITVGSAVDTQSFAPLHVVVSGGTVTTSAGSSADEVAAGSGGPVLTSSTVTFTPSP